MTALVRYEAARHALQVAHSVDEVKDIRDKAEAMAAYARQAKDTELVEWATEIKVRAERRAGEILRDMSESGERAGRGRQPQENKPATLADLEISEHQSKRWQKLAAVPEEQFEQAVAAAKEVAGEVTTAALLKLGDKRNSFTGEVEWYTPSEYIEAARTLMGAIDLDPATSEAAQENVKASRFYTEVDDGLSRDWEGRVWLNPPYGAIIDSFVSKLVSHVEDGSIPEAVLLTHNSCDTGWWHKAHDASAAFVHTRGRINFMRSDGFTASPPLGQTFFYFGNRPVQFARVFGKFGCASLPMESA